MTPKKQRGNSPSEPSSESRSDPGVRENASRDTLPDGALPPHAATPRAWMTPVAPDTTSPVIPLPPPAVLEPSPVPDADHPDATFTVGSDFHVVSLQHTTGSIFTADAAPGMSLWSVVAPQARRVLYQAFKQLLGGEERVVCHASLEDSKQTVCRFDCTRQGDDFFVRYGCQDCFAQPLASDLVTESGPLMSTMPTAAAPTSSPRLLPSGPLALPPPISVSRSDELRLDSDLFRYSPDIVCVLDTEGLVSQINPSGEQALRFSRYNVPGLPFTDLVIPEDHDQVRRTWEQIATASGPVSLLCRCNGVNGDVRWIQWNFASVRAEGSPQIHRVYATGRDMTEHRSREESLHWHLYHDALTGLANRSLLQDRLQYAIALAHRYKHKAAVLFLDLDRFKRVNDTLGHASGDALLREVAKRLTVGLREEDTVARLAGDEFIVILPRVQDFRDAQLVAEKILARVGQPLMLAGQELFVTASIGISLYPQDGTTPDALLRSADTAMYRAKAGGPGRFSVFDTALAPSANRKPESSMERLRLENNLSQAIERDELFLHYQPQISIASGQVVGAEALMRWKSGDGLVPPSTFIPLAEETGLIVRLGTWAMHEAIVQAGQWRREGHPVQVAVNLSAMQLSDPHLPDMLDTYLRQWQIPASLLDLELTERTFVNAESSMLDVLKRLKTMGVSLSVDDFGTGYGTFSYLRKFPIDGLKVDQSFTAHVDTNPADEAVVRSIIDLAHTLNLRVIAEGVETVGQRDKLTALGCDTMQGYLFSKALPADDLSPLLVYGGKM